MRPWPLAFGFSSGLSPDGSGLAEASGPGVFPGTEGSGAPGGNTSSVFSELDPNSMAWRRRRVVPLRFNSSIRTPKVWRDACRALASTAFNGSLSALAT